MFWVGKHVLPSKRPDETNPSDWGALSYRSPRWLVSTGKEVRLTLGEKVVLSWFSGRVSVLNPQAELLAGDQKTDSPTWGLPSFGVTLEGKPKGNPQFLTGYPFDTWMALFTLHFLSKSIAPPGATRK